MQTESKRVPSGLEFVGLWAVAGVLLAIAYVLLGNVLSTLPTDGRSLLQVGVVGGLLAAVIRVAWLAR